MSGHRDVGVVLPCAGIGTRVGADRPKQFLDVGGRPIFLWSLETFLAHDRVREAVLVVGAGEEAAVRAMLSPAALQALESGRLRTALGGQERWQSVRNGVQVLDAACRLVLVHDVARPFLRPEDIERGCAALETEVAMTLAMPATDTIKWATSAGDRVETTLDRRRVWLTQTPQGFRREALEGCYARPDLETMGLTDEAGLLETCGQAVALVKGGDHLRKITLPEDLAWARWQATLQR